MDNRDISLFQQYNMTERALFREKKRNISQYNIFQSGTHSQLIKEPGRIANKCRLKGAHGVDKWGDNRQAKRHHIPFLLSLPLFQGEGGTTTTIVKGYD